MVPIYSAGFQVTATLANSDTFALSGSGAKKIQLLEFGIGGYAGTAVNVDFLIVARTTLDSGGTSSSIGIPAIDQAYPSSTATLLNYTVAPTLGSSSFPGGVLKRLFLPLAAATPWNQPIVLRWDPSVAPTITGSTQQLGFNFVTAITSPAINVWWMWAEV